MGKFMYGAPHTSVEFDDRVLAHLKVVIIAKFRRGESFTFTWRNTPESGGGHNSIWLNPSVPLQFEFYGSKDPQLNRNWLEELARLTNTPAGLQVVPEPPETTSVADKAANPDVKSQGQSTATQGTKQHGGTS